MLIKKTLNIIISLLLLVSTSGIIINKHYSGDELFSTALFVEAESCCETSCCHHQDKNSCSEESDFYKLSTDFTVPESSDHGRFELETALPFFVPAFAGSPLAFHDAFSHFRLPPLRPPPLQQNLSVRFSSLLL